MNSKFTSSIFQVFPKCFMQRELLLNRSTLSPRVFHKDIFQRKIHSERIGTNTTGHLDANYIVPTLQEFADRLNTENVSTTPYEKAIRYLQAASSTVGFQTTMFYSESNAESHITMKPEVFTPAIVYDLISQLPGIDSKIHESLLDFIEDHMSERGTFNFLVDKKFNDDVDTTSVCLLALLKSKRISLEKAKGIAQWILSTTKFDTIFKGKESRQVIQTYFPPFKYNSKFKVNSLDAGVMCNALRIMYFLDMDSLARDTEDFVQDWLEDERMLRNGTEYYESPDWLLYFLSNCVSASERARSRFRDILIKRFKERLGTTRTPFDLAQRILIAFNLELIPLALGKDCNKSKEKHDEEEIARLLKTEIHHLCQQQNVDGSWPLDKCYRHFSIYFANRTAVTAFAAKALYVSRSIE